MKVSVDAAVCSGHGLCYVNAPGLFVDDDEGYGKVVGDGAIGPDDVETARAAAANCPERAISVDG